MRPIAFHFENLAWFILLQSSQRDSKACSDWVSLSVFLPPAEFCRQGASHMSEEKKVCTVVIVDDEESIRTLVQATLEGPECRVLLAANGHEALALAHSQHPQVIVLDWMMPGMSGLEFLHRLNP